MSYLTFLRIIHLVQGICMFACWWNFSPMQRSTSSADVYCTFSVLSIAGNVIGLFFPESQEKFETILRLCWKVIGIMLHINHSPEMTNVTSEVEKCLFCYSLSVIISFGTMAVKYLPSL